MPDYLSPSEAADEIGVSVETVRRWIDAGHLEAWRTPGGHRKIERTALRRFLFESEGS